MYIRDYVMEHARLMIQKGNEARRAELSKEQPRIPVSQIGHCPRQAIFEAARYHPDHPLHAEPTHPFDDYVIEVMECGNMWEHQTTRALALALGDKVHWAKNDPVLRVGDDVWSGHIDYVAEPCEEYPTGAIIEHKATNPINFQRKNRLPYLFHCLQALTYERLYRQQHGLNHALPTWLYYRSWNNWAELEVWDDGRYINWDGELNGRECSGELEMECSLNNQMAFLEETWRSKVLPPRYETPFTRDFTCARRDNKKKIAWPNCRYFGACWPEKPQWAEPSGLEEWG
jgi:hypothetical protein